MKRRYRARSGRRKAGALLLSLLVHAALLVPVAFLPLPQVAVQAEVEVSVLPPAPEVAESTGGEALEETPPDDAPSADGEKPRKPKRPGTRTDVTSSELAPSGARVIVLVRTSRLRPHPDLVELATAVMALLPDYQWARTVGIDPVQDFSILLVATANPYDVTQIFLAARLERDSAATFEPPGGQDPRLIKRLPPDVLLLARPEHMDSAGRAWAERLQQLARAGDEAGAPVLEATVLRLRGGLAFEGIRVPLPERGTGRIFVGGRGHGRDKKGDAQPGQADVGAAPQLEVELDYGAVSDAQAVEETWPDVVDRIGSSTLLAWMGLSDVASRARLERNGRKVRLEILLAPRHVQSLTRVMDLLVGQLRGRVHRAP